jgi:hypothetical protein
VSGLKGEFDVNGESVVVDALMDLDFTCNQEASTEVDSLINGLSIKLSDDPELHAEVDLLDVRSMASDHALGAQATSKGVDVKKDEELANLPEAAMTPRMAAKTTCKRI